MEFYHETTKSQEKFFFKIPLTFFIIISPKIQGGILLEAEKSIAETKIWQNVLSLLRGKVDSSSMAVLMSLDEIYLSNGNLYIYTPDQLFKDWIESEVKDIVEDTVNNILGEKIKIHVLSIKENRQKSEKVNISSKEDDFYQYLSLNPKYTFDNLIIGNCNKVAYSSCVAVADNPGSLFNPLFIYGDVGLGKTHLLHATAYQILKKNQSARIIYTTADTFASELFSYIQRGKILDFRKKYRDIDLLLIDDIQFLVGKERSQIEFYHIFNVLFNMGKQIVVSSDKPPSELDGIEKRLISRFSSGLIVEVTKPDLETKLKIIAKKSKDIGVELTKDIMLFIAKTVNSSVRELEGSLKRIKAYKEVMDKQITLEVVRGLLKDLIETKNIPSLSVEKIQREVANYFNININEMVSNSRKKKVVLARQIAIYLSKELTDEPLSNISKMFKKKDHTTIINAIEKTQELLNKDRKIFLTVEFLKNKLVSL